MINIIGLFFETCVFSQHIYEQRSKLVCKDLAWGLKWNVLAPKGIAKENAKGCTHYKAVTQGFEQRSYD